MNSTFTLLEDGYKDLEGKIGPSDLLMAIAIKRTMRSDRLYQPLFEANILKYLIQGVMGARTFRFHVYTGSNEGADVEGQYKAASLVSLMLGKQPERAIDKLMLSTNPIQTAQAILTDLAALFLEDGETYRQLPLL